jgi:hypothetical protein
MVDMTQPSRELGLDMSQLAHQFLLRLRALHVTRSTITWQKAQRSTSSCSAGTPGKPSWN